MDPCTLDHSFNGSENEIGLRKGEEGPQPPNKTKTESDREEEHRLMKLMIASDELLEKHPSVIRLK